MTSKSSRLCLLLWPLSVAPAYSAAIQNLTFTDVVKDVTVINVATKQESPAKAGDVLVPPNVLKTGPDSRAELIAEDKTVTRVGSNTIFSVEADTRDVNIAQGSVLFNSPKGKGGGRIKSAGATASVLGTTLIVGANQAGGFKVMLLEGKGQINGAKGGSAKLSPGQMSFALPGKPPTAPLNFELKGNVANSKLVGGFSKPLASIAKIEAAVNVQQAKIASGELQTTGLAIGDKPGVAVVVDPTLLSNVVARAVEEVKAIAKAVETARNQIIQKVVDQVPVKDETGTARGDVVDPRYVLAVAKNLSIRSSDSPADYIFSIDGAGKTPEGWLTASTIPKSVRQTGNPDISALIAKNIDIKLNAIDSTTTESFLHSPFIPRDEGAIIALQDIKISGNLDLTGFDKVRRFPNLLGVPITAGQDKIQLTSAFGLEKGFFVAGVGIADNTYIKEVDSINNTITLSKPATETAASVDIFGILQVNAVAGSNQATISLKRAIDAGSPFNPLTGLLIGMTVSSNYFPDGTVISAIGDDGVLTLSKPSTGSGSGDVFLGGVESGTPLTISAGHTLLIEPGSVLKTSTSLLDIYAAGTEFAADISLAAKVSAAKEPLVLDRVSIENEWPLQTTTASGAIKITAPQISILDSKIRAADIKIESVAGDIDIASHDIRGTITTVGDVSKITISDSSDISGIKVGQTILADGLPVGTKVDSIQGRVLTLSAKATADSTTPLLVVSPIPLGITDVDDLAINSYALSLKSSGNISIRNVPLYAVDSTFEAGGAISLSGVNLRNSLLEQDQTLSALAKSGDLNIASTKAAALVQTSLVASTGNVVLTDSEFGSEFGVNDANAIKTSFRIVSEKADLAIRSLLNTNTSIYADSVTLTSQGNIDIAGASSSKPVTIGPTDSTQGSFDIFAKTGAVNVSNAQLNHYTVNITAGGDLVDPIATRGSSPSAAQARNEINLYGVLATNAQRIALDATTIVLEGVTFKDGSNVFLNSFHGKVAAYPGEGKAKEAGYVNFIRNVYYGSTEIIMKDSQGNTVDRAKAAMTNAQFHEAATQAGKGSALQNIKIGAQTGNAKTVN